MRKSGVVERIYPIWPYAGLTACVFLLAMVPLLRTSWPLATLAVFVQLPVYMIHQMEEHYDDRFRSFLNQRLARGLNALTKDDVLTINLGGVWGVDLAALYLAWFVAPGLGLVAIYLALVNGAAHIVAAAVFRRYNPGLITAALLLLPGGVWGWLAIVKSGDGTRADHALGLGHRYLHPYRYDCSLQQPDRGPLKGQQDLTSIPTKRHLS